VIQSSSRRNLGGSIRLADITEKVGNVNFAKMFSSKLVTLCEITWSQFIP
jgi:hypothetical protein